MLIGTCNTKTSNKWHVCMVPYYYYYYIERGIFGEHFEHVLFVEGMFDDKSAFAQPKQMKSPIAMIFNTYIYMRGIQTTDTETG